MNQTRAPTDEVREKVWADYQKGVKPKQLAENYGISVNTIKSWIRREKQKIPQNDEGAPARKRGAPSGNQNAAGRCDAKRGNRNAEIHGGYSSVILDCLDEDELELYGQVPTKEEDLLLDSIRLLSIRERRIMLAINKYREKEKQSGVYVDQVVQTENKREFKNDEAGQADQERFEELRQEKIDEGRISYLGRQYQVTTTMEGTINVIQRLEKELTSVQNSKNKAIDSLMKLHQFEHDIKNDKKGNDVARLWVEKVMAKRSGGTGHGQ